uniref:Uncharacterized protein n=1 Tax=Arundo donax TaxID=35708 RepID=A0A0A9GUM0_ARUDO
MNLRGLHKQSSSGGGRTNSVR